MNNKSHQAAEQPMTFDAANNWIKSRVNVLTNMSSAELALSKNFPPKVRAHCFFSAKVAEAGILDKLREEVDRFARGEVDIATTRMKLKLFLSSRGYAPDDVSNQQEPPPGVGDDDWKRQKSVSNLASTARLDLILSQNARMAHAVGQREVSMDPDIRERWPFFRYLAEDDTRVRDSHAALDNLVLPKDDPFWNTHTPPWDYNCRCDIEDCDAEEAKEYGGIDQAITTDNPDGSQSARLSINGRAANVYAAASGYVFDVNEAFSAVDAARIKPLYREAVMSSLRAFVASEKLNRFTVYGAPAEDGTALARPENYAEVQNYFQNVEKVMKKYQGSFPDKAPGDLPDVTQNLGMLHESLRQALGLKADESQVVISKGTRQRGLVHWYRNHHDEISDSSKALKILDESLFNPMARTVMVLNNDGKNKEVLHVGIDNPDTGAFCYLRQLETTKRGGIKQKHFEVATIMKADDEFRSRQWVLKYM